LDLIWRKKKKKKKKKIENQPEQSVGGGTPDGGAIAGLLRPSVLGLQRSI